MTQRFQPDLTGWNKESKGVYVRADGLAKVVHKANLWIPYSRDSLDSPWFEEKEVFLTLHAAQSHCN